MVLGSTQPLTEMSTRNLPGGEGRSARKADNLTAICDDCQEKMWEPRLLTILWASTDLLFYVHYVYNILLISESYFYSHPQQTYMPISSYINVTHKHKEQGNKVLE
jgi:hypothetical protein